MKWEDFDKLTNEELDALPDELIEVTNYLGLGGSYFWMPKAYANYRRNIKEWEESNAHKELERKTWYRDERS